MARLARFLLLFYHIKAQKHEKGNQFYYAPDFSLHQEKEKVVLLCKELIIDMKNKIHMTDAIRSTMELDHTFLFHVGTTLGGIREKYKSQLEMYRQMRDKFNQRHYFYSPEYKRGVYSMHFVIAMEEIYGKEVEIENYILALLKVPAHQFDEHAPNSPVTGLDIESGHGKFMGKPDSAKDHRDADRPNEKTTPGNKDPPPGMFFAPPGRSGHNGEIAENVKMSDAKAMSEDELKRNMRAQYYKRHKN